MRRDLDAVCVWMARCTAGVGAAVALAGAWIAVCLSHTDGALREGRDFVLAGFAMLLSAGIGLVLLEGGGARG